VQHTCQALRTDVAKKGVMYKSGEAPGSQIAEPQSSGWTGARTRCMGQGRGEGGVRFDVSAGKNSRDTKQRAERNECSWRGGHAGGTQSIAQRVRSQGKERKEKEKDAKQKRLGEVARADPSRQAKRWRSQGGAREVLRWW